MLVLSRKSKDRISFPQVGITVHFIRVQSGHVKVGIDAPADISILRDEIDNDGSAAHLTRRQLLRLPREVRHGIRNELHEISVAMHLYRELVKANLTEEAEEVFDTLKQSLKRLDENQVLQRPLRDKERPASNRLIALLEDKENERHLLASFLRLKGFDVVDFGNGEEALDYFSDTTPPNVILVDMHMPVCNGPETVRVLRDTDRFEHTSIFAVSGSTPKDYGLEIGRTGVDRWFPKPLNTEILVDAIDRLVPVDCPQTILPPTTV